SPATRTSRRWHGAGAAGQQVSRRTSRRWHGPGAAGEQVSSGSRLAPLPQARGWPGSRCERNEAPEVARVAAKARSNSGSRLHEDRGLRRSYSEGVTACRGLDSRYTGRTSSSSNCLQSMEKLLAVTAI